MYLLGSLQPLVQAAPVMAVDYGSDALKVSKGGGAFLVAVLRCRSAGTVLEYSHATFILGDVLTTSTFSVFSHCIDLI